MEQPEQHKSEDLAAVTTITNGLVDIGKSLAAGVKENPPLSAILLIVVVGAMVLLGFGILSVYSDPSWLSLLGLAFFFFLLAIIGLLAVIIYLVIVGVQHQRQQVRDLPRMSSILNSGVVNLAQTLTVTQKQNILKLLQGAAEDVARLLGVSKELVRSNLFDPTDDNRLRIVSELTFNMNREKELTISMPIGYGSSGRCFQSARPNIAVLREDWGKDNIEGPELRKVDPDLQWIISIPVLADGDTNQPIWVLNVDGLKERRNEEDLRIALGSLFSWSQMISLVAEIP